jgi:hypothetical protein
MLNKHVVFIPEYFGLMDAPASIELRSRSI